MVGGGVKLLYTGHTGDVTETLVDTTLYRPFAEILGELCFVLLRRDFVLLGDQ